MTTQPIDPWIDIAFVLATPSFIDGEPVLNEDDMTELAEYLDQARLIANRSYEVVDSAGCECATCQEIRRQYAQRHQPAP
jgi:hypothetical protein